MLDSREAVGGRGTSWQLLILGLAVASMTALMVAPHRIGLGF